VKNREEGEARRVEKLKHIDQEESYYLRQKVDELEK